MKSHLNCKLSSCPSYECKRRISVKLKALFVKKTSSFRSIELVSVGLVRVT